MIITDEKYFTTYSELQPVLLDKHIKRLQAKNLFPDMGFNIILSAVNSSMLEGNPVDMGSYLNYKSNLPGYFNRNYQEINELIDAYTFASDNPLTALNILNAHKILRNSFLPAQYRGILRDKEVVVRNNNTGETLYAACPVSDLQQDCGAFIRTVEALVNTPVKNINEIFFLAAQLHYWMVTIHPFSDGNGRISRLIEKWFLASQIGSVAWKIPSEFMYRKRQQQYYKILANIRSTYSKEPTNKIIDFLMMLLMALTIKVK